MWILNIRHSRSASIAKITVFAAVMSLPLTHYGQQSVVSQIQCNRISRTDHTTTTKAELATRPLAIVHGVGAYINRQPGTYLHRWIGPDEQPFVLLNRSQSAPSVAEQHLIERQFFSSQEHMQTRYKDILGRDKKDQRLINAQELYTKTRSLTPTDKQQPDNVSSDAAGKNLVAALLRMQAMRSMRFIGMCLSQQVDY